MVGGLPAAGGAPGQFGPLVKVEISLQTDMVNRTIAAVIEQMLLFASHHACRSLAPGGAPVPLSRWLCYS